MVFLEKWMNMFTGDLYSMYVILQGTGSLSWIRVYIIYVIPFGEQQPWISEVPKPFQQKKQVPRNDHFFYIVLKKMSFWSSPKRRTMVKKLLYLEKIDEHSPGFHGLSRLVSKNIASDVPRNDQFLFVLYSKKWVFQAHLRLPLQPVP